MEEEIFKKAKVCINKLIEYGFKKEKDLYVYTTYIMNNTFKVMIFINDLGSVSGKIIDEETNEEYTNIRVESSLSFINEVKNNYISVLNDIKENCFEENTFIFEQSNRICNYIKNKYSNVPEFLWDKFSGYAVFRKNKKWYALIMNIDKSKIDDGSGQVEIINLKIDKNKIKELLNKDGFYKSYHMNSKYWISIILDGTVSDEILLSLIDESYNNV